jgi:hypothetical protein
VDATAQGGNAVMAIPPMANIEAIRTSAVDDATSHRLGREPHMSIAN